VINYFVPENATSAQLIIYDINGRLMKKVKIENGFGKIHVYGADMVSGTYTYSILVDGKVMSAKKMVSAK